MRYTIFISRPPRRFFLAAVVRPAKHLSPRPAAATNHMLARRARPIGRQGGAGIGDDKWRLQMRMIPLIVAAAVLSTAAEAQTNVFYAERGHWTVANLVTRCFAVNRPPAD